MTSSPELERWLVRLAQLHPAEIELGLDRVSTVADRAGLLDSHCPVISVAGTNGKGSVVAALVAMYREAGFIPGSYTSPHILRYNERICVNGEPVGDERIIEAFEYLDHLRGEVPLTYFEMSTLAALWIFKEENTDVTILEVGLGGRLDAVNMIDADVSVITSIAIDHESWLGMTREAIATEKAGIARRGRPLIVGDRLPPQSLFRAAREAGARLRCIQTDFDYSLHSDHWVFRSMDGSSLRLPQPALVGSWQYDNASVAISCVQELSDKLPVDNNAIAAAMRSMSLAGRYQRGHFRGHPVVMDVGHNPAAVKGLVEQLTADFPRGVRAVFAVMADKAVDEIVSLASPVVCAWYLAALENPRAMGKDQLAAVVRKHVGGERVRVFDSAIEALAAAVDDAPEDQIVLIFGSFFTLSAVAELID